MGGGTYAPFFSATNTGPCQDLLIKTQLYSPNPEVLQLMREGDKLDITILSPAGPCVALFNKKNAGSIISKELPQLIQCINTGFTFQGVVRRVKSGECSITISSIK